MNKSTSLMISLTMCVFFARYTHAENKDDLNVLGGDSVNIILTKLDVNDSELNLAWKIKNKTDHDVWICDSITTSYDFDWFLDKDDETLVIIRRFVLQQGQGWEHWPWARFIRLRPSQEKDDSISLPVPVRPHTKFSHVRGNSEYAKRIALEIGFYNEDLRGLILNIVDLAEQLNCDTSLSSNVVTFPDAQISERFFAGVYIARVFHGESFGGFRNSVLSDGDEISMPYMNQFFHGEKLLRIEVDGVSIPYKSNYPLLAGQAGQGGKDLRSKKANNTKLAKSDSKEPSEPKDNTPGK